jgi:glycine cleavage system H protein
VADDIAWTPHATPTPPAATLNAALDMRDAALHLSTHQDDPMPDYLETTVDKFIFRVATDRHYSPGGAWAQPDGDRIRIGVTDFLQQRSGDVAFAEIKAAGRAVVAGDEVAVIETIKANVEVPSPVGGTVVEVNPAMALSPEVINQDPYGEGWLVVIQASDWPTDRDALLDPQAYFELMKGQAEEEAQKL